MVGTGKVRVLLITLLGVLLLIKPSLGMALSDVRLDDEDSFRNIQKLFKKRKQDLDEYAELTARYGTITQAKKTPPVRTTSFNTTAIHTVADFHYTSIPLYITPHRKVYLLSGKLSI